MSQIPFHEDDAVLVDAFCKVNSFAYVLLTATAELRRLFYGRVLLSCRNCKPNSLEQLLPQDYSINAKESIK